MRTASDWIRKLQLTKHPTVGCYAETYRSSKLIMSKDKKAVRHAHSSIYYLLEGMVTDGHP